MRAIPAGKLTEMVGEYVSEKTGMTLQTGMYQAFAVVNEHNDFVAGTVISNFRGTDCEVSCVSETPAAWRPAVLRVIFKYIFEQLGCVRCTAITTKRNKRAREFLKALGFELEGNIRRGYDGKIDALIYGLLAADCRFLADDSGEQNGEEIRPEGPGSTRPGSDGASANADEQGICRRAGELEQDRPVHAAG
jgi:hypothetical protein